MDGDRIIPLCLLQGLRQTLPLYLPFPLPDGEDVQLRTLLSHRLLLCSCLHARRCGSLPELSYLPQHGRTSPLLASAMTATRASTANWNQCLFCYYFLIHESLILVCNIRKITIGVFLRWVSGMLAGWNLVVRSGRFYRFECTLTGYPLDRLCELRNSETAKEAVLGWILSDVC